jgi:hypothetical protein
MAASKSGREINPAQMVDNLIKKHVAKVVRGIDDVALANGGKGARWHRANQALNLLIESLEGMKGGEK